MLNITKEEAIDIYLKMLHSPNCEGNGNYMHLYNGRQLIASASITGIFNEKLYLGGELFELTDEESQMILEQIDIARKLTKEDILKAL